MAGRRLPGRIKADTIRMWGERSAEGIFSKPIRAITVPITCTSIVAPSLSADSISRTKFLWTASFRPKPCGIWKNWDTKGFERIAHGKKRSGQNGGNTSSTRV